MCDGSTDSAVIEEVMVFIRYINSGHIQSCFVSLGAVEKGTAVNIAAAIKHACQTFLGLEGADFTKKLVGFGSDGASVMQGRKGGVAALLVKVSPGFNRCIA